MSMNIAIDGPAGAGKSTIAKKLAGDLSYIYVDTGAMYRALAYDFLQKGIGYEEQEKIKEELQQVQVTIGFVDGEQRVFLNDEDVSGEIRKEEVGNMASHTSVYPFVREKLLSLQREMAKKYDVVMDGRDIGTTILPDAQVKIFLTASVQVRAMRRYKELLAKGQEADLAQIEADIEERDYRDSHREVAPLKQAEDAVLLDSSDMTIEEVVEKMKEIIKEKN